MHLLRVQLAGGRSVLEQRQHASGVPLATEIPVISLGRTHESNTSYPPRHDAGRPVLGGRGGHDSISKTRGISAVLHNPRKIHQRGFSTASDKGGDASSHLLRDLKMALAGALAGAVATGDGEAVDRLHIESMALFHHTHVDDAGLSKFRDLSGGEAALFPIDTAKTLRQADPHRFHGTRDALAHLCRTRGALSVYRGLPTAVLGAMPSSALYFGTYEAVKVRVLRLASWAFPLHGEGSGAREGEGLGPDSGGNAGPRPMARAAAHAVAAACGNAASSLVFVPKEFVKQTLQASGMEAAGRAQVTARQVIRQTLREQGVRGLYRGYWPTLSRNVPSAVIRFSLYEEMKLLLGPARLKSPSPVLLLVGAVAGACASGVTTPFDVLKTRVATGSMDGSRGFASNMASIVAEDGWQGLFAGFQPRVAMSALFTAVGFTSFEAFKTILGVPPLENGAPLERSSGSSRD